MMFVHDRACSAVTQEENLAVNVLQQLLTKQHCFERTYIQNYIGYLKIINYISAHRSIVFYFRCSVYWWKRGVSNFSVLRY